uniref:Uncharacterized protein n=1 Tax=Desulfacinum infernum TaxID=35837 RepID=A0A832EJJ4_9BACT
MMKGKRKVVPHAAPKKSPRPGAGKRLGIALRTSEENLLGPMEVELEVLAEEEGDSTLIEASSAPSEACYDEPDGENLLTDEDDALPIQPIRELFVEGHAAADAEGCACPSVQAGIVITLNGDVIVPLEASLLKRQAIGPLSRLAPRGDLGSGPIRAEQLRHAGKEIVKVNRDEILCGPQVFHEARLHPLKPKDVWPTLQPPNRSHLLATTFVHTPLWGLVPLRVFFEGSHWTEIMEFVQDLIDREDPAKPFSTAYLWREAQNKYSDWLASYSDDRVFRNKLGQEGIPKAKGRREIHDFAQRYVRDTGIRRLPAGGVKAVLDDMLQRYPQMFRKQTQVCRDDEKYRRFVLKRLERVLQEKLRTVADEEGWPS